MVTMLTGTEKAVVQTMTMKLLPTSAVQYLIPTSAVQYLNDVGFKMSRATYFR